ncbi:MAG TPA: helix-turn-helix transcriptional regulator [Phycisphaerae bacterium]|nr:helix-turn-helix transcriptional regulator [Phycisphaerae bacterium]
MSKSKKKSVVRTKIEDGSGNVFADIGARDPEEALMKAQIALVIGQLIGKLRITQAEAAVKLGIDQPKVSMLLSGRLRDFSIERLFRFLRALEHDIRIVISPHKRRHAAVSVEMAA